MLRLRLLRKRLPNDAVISGMPLIQEFMATGPQIRLMVQARDPIDPDGTMPHEQLYLELAAWGKANREALSKAR